MERCIWYLDNILIHNSNTEAEHHGIVRKVLQQYIEHGLVGNLLKSVFHVYKTIFLKYVCHNQKIKIQVLRLETMSIWPIPMRKIKVQSFSGFANYYC